MNGTIPTTNNTLKFEKVEVINVAKNYSLVSNNVQKESMKSTLPATLPTTFKKNISDENNDNNNITNMDLNDKTKGRRDYFNNEIKKKSKIHKLTWVDKINKTQPVTNIIKIDNYKNYNLYGAQNEKKLMKQDTVDDEKDKTVRCKCCIQ
jgi:hypothetical protein